MDPTQTQQQPIQPTPQVAPPLVNPTPAPQQQIPPAQNPTDAPKSLNKVFVVVAGIFVLLLITGTGAYYFLGQKQSTQQIAQTTPQTQLPTTVPTIAQTAEEKEIESIDIETLDADFADIEKDLAGL